MTILDKIVKHKETEINKKKKITSLADFENSEKINRKTYSLKKNILEKNPGIIAEFKRKSPSKGIINSSAKIDDTTRQYTEAGAAGLSVLTDLEFFGGKNEDLEKAREVNQIPILRKDFIIDTYQIAEAKCIGADVILLIAAILSKNQVKQLASYAKSLNLEILFEIHTKEELDKLNENIDIVGVNNRNLKTFEVSIDTSIKLFNDIPDEFVKISESGINQPENIKKLMDTGYQGFLIGENFMKTNDPGNSCIQFLKEIQNFSR